MVNKFCGNPQNHKEHEWVKVEPDGRSKIGSCDGVSRYEDEPIVESYRPETEEIKAQDGTKYYKVTVIVEGDEDVKILEIDSAPYPAFLFHHEPIVGLTPSDHEKSPALKKIEISIQPKNLVTEEYYRVEERTDE